MIKVGNAGGFWGDRPFAARDLLRANPELDFITLDYLSELSLSILAIQQQKDQTKGFVKDVLEMIQSLVSYWKKGGKCRLVTNGGGFNPVACGEAIKALLQSHGLNKRVGVVFGDDVKDKLVDFPFPALVSANAYLGSQEIASALDQGAEIVITGRVADPSLTCGPCLHHFRWGKEDFTKIAGATIAGHLIECGTQLTGGITTDWLLLSDQANIGFPIAEIEETGECILTKQKGSTGVVSEATVKEQLLYEIGDPAAYLSPDVTASLMEAIVTEVGKDRVRLKGVIGSRPKATYKVSACYRAGYQAEGILAIMGKTAAKRAAEVVLERVKVEKSQVDVIGEGMCFLRISVFDPTQSVVEAFSKEWASLVTNGPPGTTGYARGRPQVREVFGYHPCLIEKKNVQPEVILL